MPSKKIFFCARGFCAAQILVLVVIGALGFFIWNTIKTSTAYKTITLDGVQMRFVECVTGEPTARGAQELPLIIAFHGLGDRAHHFRARFQGMEYPARIIIPEAYESNNTSWYDHHRKKEAIPLSALRAAAFVRAIKKKYGVTERPVVYGFSQGGVLALYMSLWDPALFSQAIIESAYLSSSLHPPVRRLDIEYPRIRQFHGLNDKLVFPDDARRGAANIIRLGIPLTLEEYERPHQVFDPELLPELYRELREAAEAVFE
jgi:phospholipase/carboxylesterase